MSAMTAAIRTTQRLTEAKRTGSHFTPPALADYVARRIYKAMEGTIWGESIEVLDPSCGDGELLRAFIEATPEDKRGSVKLVGVEDNDVALAETRRRLSRFHALYELLHADFLQLSEAFTSLPTLPSVLFATNATPQISQPDVIIANPPYVRTQVLGSERAQELAARFQLRGRVDLYHAFLIAMTDTLKQGGVLGVITSNRFLTTRSGEGLRAFLSERYDLLEVVDLGDTKLFSAAVLPAVVIARKRSSGASSSPHFVRIYEDIGRTEAEERADLFEILETNRDGRYKISGKVFQVTSGALTLRAASAKPWRMTSPTETAWVQRVEQSTPLRLGDLAKVRVGIKTTADSIFIRNDWNSIPRDERPERRLLHPVYTHHDAERWRPNKSPEALFRILYTHEVVAGRRRPINLAKYPRAKAYLDRHRERLAAREFVVEAGRHWWEIWVPQDPLAWAHPKVIFPDISVQPRFFFDDSGALVNGDCYWLALPPEQLDLLYLIQGCANSAVMATYHDLAFQNKLYSGRRRFISQYVEHYPIPDPKKREARKIIATVRELNTTASRSRQATLEKQIDGLVSEAFGIFE